MIKKQIIVIIIIFSSINIYCQNTSIKGGILPTLYYNTVSLGFEWKVSNHSAIDLVGHAEMSMIHPSYSSYGYIEYRVGYKYYIVDSLNKFFNNHWFGAYFTQLKEDVQTCSEGSGFKANNYGIGISIGKQINISKNKKTYMNIGFRVSYLKRDIISKTSCEEPYNIEVTDEDDYFYFRPNLILNFGFKL